MPSFAIPKRNRSPLPNFTKLLTNKLPFPNCLEPPAFLYLLVKFGTGRSGARNL